ncbi:MAG: monovalent cation/H+ antiporter complex subunit F [Paracoccaceae bacterium]
MTAWLTFIALGILGSLAAALLRVWHGPGRADRMMGAQLVGSGGVAVLLLLAPVQGWAALDVALTFALFGALAAIGFVKAASPDGGGDPEEDDSVVARPEADADG